MQRLALAFLICLLGAAGASGQQKPVDMSGTTLDTKLCNDVETELQRIAPEHELTIVANDARAGAPIELSWRAPAEPYRIARYLVAAFDRPMRFSGGDFYALAPGAAGPFDMAFGRDATRLVIPLQQAGIPEAGTVSAMPLEARPLQITTAFVGISGCGENVFDEQSVTLDVGPGRPVIQVADPFDLETPDTVVSSPDGSRMLQVFSGRWRLVEAGNGQLVAEGTGTEPRFSPSGRFITAVGEAAIALIDTIDGGLVARASPIDPSQVTEIGWAANDSFLLLAGSRMGALAIYSTLAPDREILAGQPACMVCDALLNTALSIDLRNNLAIVMELSNSPDVQPVVFMASLSREVRYDPYGLSEGSEAYSDAGDFALKTSMLTPFAEVAPFVETPGLRLTMVHGQSGAKSGLDDGGNAAEGWEKRAALTAEAAYVEPKIGKPAPAKDRRVAGLATPRGAVALSADAPDAGSRMKRRLAEFGIPLYPTQPLATFAPERFKPLPEIDDGTMKYPAVEMPGDAAFRLIASAQSFTCGFVEPSESGAHKFDVGIGDGLTAWQYASDEHAITILNGACFGGNSGGIDGTLFLHDTRRPGEMTNLDDNLVAPELYFATSCETGLSGCAFKLAMAHGRYLLIWSAEANGVAVYDIERRRMQASLYGLPNGSLLDDVSLTPNGRTLVATNSDGSFEIFDISERPGTYIPADFYVWRETAEPPQAQDWRPQPRPMLQGTYRDDEVVVWTADGFYDATYEGAAQVSLRLPGVSGRYSVRQFEGLLRKPGLAQSVLAGVFSPDAIALAAPPTAEARISRAGDRLTIDLKQLSGGALAQVLVFQDGLLTDRIAANGRREIREEVAPRPGVRAVTVVAVDGQGLSSLPLGADLPGEPAARRRLAVVAVGVDTYSSPDLSQLAYAASDARRFTDAVNAGSPLYADISVDLLTDGAATLDSLGAVLDRTIGAAEPDMDVVLFFAGHGVQDAKGRFYLTLQDTDTSDLPGTAVAWDALAARLAKSKSSVTIFLDACHSGLAGRGLFATNDNAVSTLLGSAPSGISVFAASKGRELSRETRAVAGGVFTAALADVLGHRGRADRNGDGLLQASEVFEALKRDVVGRTGGEQTPWFARNEAIGDFPLF